MLFAAVRHLAEGLSLETFTDIIGGKAFNLLSGHTETNSIHNRTTDNFTFKNINKK
jgi:hypothetical protein